MSFSIGSSGSAMGPRTAMSSFGREHAGQAFNPHVFRRLLKLLRPHRRRMLAALILMLLNSALALTIPYLIKVAIDDDIATHNVYGLLQTSFMMTAAFIGIYLAASLQQHLLAKIGLRILTALRSRLFRHLQLLPLEWHHKHIVGVTISRVISDVSVINDLLSEGVATLIGDTVLLAGIVGVMLAFHVPLALAAFTVVPLMLAATWLFSKNARIAFRQTRQRIAAVVGGLAEDISGIRVIQAFAREGVSADRFNEVNQANRDANIRAMSLSFIFLPTVDFLGVLATAIVLLYGGLLVARGETTIGVVVAFIAYVTRFFQPIQDLSQLYTTMQSAMAGGERVFELLDTVPAIQDIESAGDIGEVTGKIEFRQVDFSYIAESPVLKNIDLTLEPGQTMAIVGPTGAGKTTMANLIMRLYDVTAGAILIDGHDLRQFTQSSLRRQMALVPQEPFLFGGSVADNIRFSRPEASANQIIRAAEMANAHNFIVSLPEGYATKILEGGVNLSIGQRQLLSIARAVLADPRILIMDEATASIDTLTETLIQDALQKLLTGRTSLIIAHRLTTIKNADQICVLKNGSIIELGTHNQLMASCGIYRDLYMRQS